MEGGSKFFEFLNNNQTWCFKKQDLVVVCSVEGGLKDQNSMGILCAVIYSSSIKSMFYTETAGAAFPSVRGGFENQMHPLQQRASEFKWQEARGCHKRS